MSNKGTVLYGYRLYNVYSYKSGNTIEDRIVVSTIIQTTDEAIGYVFTDIENVTKGQGSPKTKSGISQSTFSDINTVAQLYKTVKGIDRKNGRTQGLYSGKSIDDYSRIQYNCYGWVVINKVLTVNELNRFYKEFANKEMLKFKYKKSYDGYYMIPTEDVSMFFD